MEKLFHIITNTNQPEPDSRILSMNIGDRHFSYAITSASGHRLFSLAYFAGTNPDSEFLAGLLAAEPALSQPFSEVKTEFQFSQCLLVPESYSENKAQSHELVKAMTGAFRPTEILSDAIKLHQIHAIYAVPRQVFWWLTSKFQAFKHRHHYSAILQSGNFSGEESCFFIDFRPEEFSVVVVNENQVLLAQTYSYATPDDVLFRLLKICRFFGLEQEKVQIKLSGLVEEQSALYNELFQYFLCTAFRKCPEWEAGLQQYGYPSQYFVSLKDLATCAL